MQNVPNAENEGSDCMDAQADLRLHWAHMSDGTFFDVADY